MTNKNRPGYKKTSIGWIPEDWESIKLRNCIIGTPKYGINAPAVDYSSGLPTYLRITDIDEYGKFIKNSKKSVNHKDSENYFLEEGDLVFARTGNTTGKTYLYDKNDGKLVYAGFLIKVTPDKKVLLPYFLKLYTNTEQYWYWISWMSSRSGQPGVNGKEYGLMQFPLPPLPEQKKIAEILSTWDKAISKYDTLISKYELRKKALMQKLLTGKVRFKEFEDEEWKEVKIQDLFKPIKRKNTTGCKRVLTASGENGLVDQITFFKKEVASKDTSGYYLMKRGEFAYNRSLMTGYPYGATKRLDRYEEGAISTLYLCFAIKVKEANSDFYTHYFESGVINRELRGIVQVGARAHGLLNVTQSDYMNIRIEQPSIEEQRKIASVLSAQDKQIDLLKKQKAALEQQKKGLMQVLLTGEVRVKVN